MILARCGPITATPSNTPTITVTRTRTPTNTPTQTQARTTTPTGTIVATFTFTRTPTTTPQRTITPCGECNLGILVVTSSCNVDGTVHWIAIAHNPELCVVAAPWGAELQVRENGGNFRAVRIQYATSNFPQGDTILDGVFCYRFSQNVRDVRVVYLFEDQEHRSTGSDRRVQERGVESDIPASGKARTNPSICDADMASLAMAPCKRIDACN